MRGTVPDGDLAAIIEEAVTEKLERLESRRYGKTRAPRRDLEETDTSPSSRYIPAAVRRAVAERDGNQCTFVDAEGRRCKELQSLQFHHREPYARGGDHSPENVQMMCSTHNQYLAECDYGQEVMERFRRSSSLAREPGPVYSLRIDGAACQSSQPCTRSMRSLSPNSLQSSSNFSLRAPFHRRSWRSSSSGTSVRSVARSL